MTASHPTSADSKPDVTLQINLCAGDLAYGAPMVENLVGTHRRDVREIVIVADLCRPASARDFHAPSRVPAREFSARIAGLRQLCSELQSRGVVDRVAFVAPCPAELAALNQRYAGVATFRSHDHLGHAFSAYFAGWDCARTRYVAHFDADVLLWQAPDFSWIRAAVDAIEGDRRLLAVSPRVAPPPVEEALLDPQRAAECWSPSWPLHPRPDGWSSPWFSTRCHLIDRERLAGVLPLGVPERDRRSAALDRWLRPFFRLRALSGSNRSRLARRLVRSLRPFPLPPEVLLHEQAQRRGFSCLYLSSRGAWYIHPDTKPERFLGLLPKLLEQVTVRGVFPPSQRGVSSVQFQAWEDHPYALSP